MKVVVQAATLPQQWEQQTGLDLNTSLSITLGVLLLILFWMFVRYRRRRRLPVLPRITILPQLMRRSPGPPPGPPVMPEDILTIVDERPEGSPLRPPKRHIRPIRKRRRISAVERISRKLEAMVTIAAPEDEFEEYPEDHDSFVSGTFAGPEPAGGMRGVEAATVQAYEPPARPAIDEAMKNFQIGVLGEVEVEADAGAVAESSEQSGADLQEGMKTFAEGILDEAIGDLSRPSTRFTDEPHAPDGPPATPDGPDLVDDAKQAHPNPVAREKGVFHWPAADTRLTLESLKARPRHREALEVIREYVNGDMDDLLLFVGGRDSHHLLHALHHEISDVFGPNTMVTLPAAKLAATMQEHDPNAVGRALKDLALIGISHLHNLGNVPRGPFLINQLMIKLTQGGCRFVAATRVPAAQIADITPELARRLKSARVVTV